MKTLWLALSFLTALPVPTALATDEEMGRTVALFPLVGLLIGLVNTAVFVAATKLWSPQVAAWLLLAANALLTGGLHLDGWVDTFDALGSRKSRNEMLAIMKDSRIGAIGAMALVLLIGLKCSVLTLCAEHLRILVMMPLVGRIAMAVATQLFPYGRERGLGKALTAPLRLSGWLCIIVLGLLPLALLLGLGGIVALVASLALAMLWAVYLTKRFGGLTGDCFGALNELVELSFLLTALKVLP